MRYKTVQIDEWSRKTLITRGFWLRIIWDKTQKTIILGPYRIDISRRDEPAG
jgi:hypothetical protein